MSPEKQMKDKGSPKQKIMIAAIILIFLFVGYQFMGLKNGGGGSITPAPVVNTPHSAPSPSGGAKPMMGGGGMQMQGPSMMPQAQAPSPESTQPRVVPVTANAELLKLQQQTQLEYITSINKLQMLKLQLEIDDTKTAIATAELNRMTAEKSIADMITSKGSANGLDMIGGNPTPPPISQTTPAPVPVPVAPPVSAKPVAPAEAPLTNFTALSAAYQGGKWTAVLSVNGRNFTAVVDDTLEDGSKVISISRNAVTLSRDNKTRKLIIPSSI